jgi:peptidyl-prolyl cis-trans isomerase SurA
LNDSIQYVKVEKGVYVPGDNKAIDKFGFKLKKATFEPTAEYPYVFVVGKNLKNHPEDYTDVRGLVTADYQEYLEKEWIAKLRAKFPVVVDKKVLEKIKTN